MPSYRATGNRPKHTDRSHADAPEAQLPVGTDLLQPLQAELSQHSYLQHVPEYHHTAMAPGALRNDMQLLFSSWLCQQAKPD